MSTVFKACKQKTCSAQKSIAKQTQVTSPNYIKFALLWLVLDSIFAKQRKLSSSIFCVTALCNWALNSSSGVPYQQSVGSSPGLDICVLKQETFCFILRMGCKGLHRVCCAMYKKEPSYTYRWKEGGLLWQWLRHSTLPTIRRCYLKTINLPIGLW